MTENDRREGFSAKYQGVEKIWSGPSFIQFHDYQALLNELPVSNVAVPDKQYSRKFPGNADYVFGEMLYSLTGFEGYLRDKGFVVQECFIKPLMRANTFSLEFDINYKTNNGEVGNRLAEVIRTGETSYIFFIDYYRPM